MNLDISSKKAIWMKWQALFSVKNDDSTTNLSSADLA